MWCRMIDEKGNYKHNVYGYSFDVKCVDKFEDINDNNSNWREFETKEKFLEMYNLTYVENTKKRKSYAY